MLAAIERLRARRMACGLRVRLRRVLARDARAAVDALLAEVLGDGYRQLPNFWTYFVSQDREGTGWPPHVDGTSTSGRVSLWIPLSDATTRNGCMYVVPKSLEPPAFADAFLAKPSYTGMEVAALLQASRALPAAAGSVLGWHHGVIHWGSCAEADAPPRVSIASEFVAPDAETFADDAPLIDPGGPLPSFRERIRMIARCLLDYRRFEPSVVKFTPLAERLLES